MVPSAPPFWRAAFIVLTVCVLVVGSSAPARERGSTNFAENLFIGISNACRSIMKSYSRDPALYDETMKLKVIWYGPSGPEKFPIDEAIDHINQTSLLEQRNMTVIAIHGFNDHAESAIPRSIAQAYLKRRNFDVMLLDCSEITTGQYVRAAYMSQLIGRKLAYFLSRLNKIGIPSNSIHLIGLSLGAQISGWAGRFYKSLTGDRIHRITGLDPAGPCFTYAGSKASLNYEDADFVDVIHVNKGIEGILEDVGHVDFFVNGGGPNQPGCLSPGCSHQRAGSLFLESLEGSTPFIARKCTSWNNFNEDACSDNEMTYMGFNCSVGMRGNFYLRTSTNEPFSLGIRGSRPKRKSNVFERLFNLG